MRTKVGVMFLPVLALAAGPGIAMAAPAGSASSVTSQAAAGSQAEGVPAFGHVFLIIGENTTYSRLKASNAPYLLGTIRPRAAWLVNYYAATHWSQANYVALSPASSPAASSRTAVSPATRTLTTSPVDTAASDLTTWPWDTSVVLA